MLRLCDDGHDEVCYQGKDCPVCALLAEVKELKSNEQENLDQIDDLKIEASDLREELKAKAQ